MLPLIHRKNKTRTHRFFILESVACFYFILNLFYSVFRSSSAGALKRSQEQILAEKLWIELNQRRGEEIQFVSFASKYLTTSCLPGSLCTHSGSLLHNMCTHLLLPGKLSMRDSKQIGKQSWFVSSIVGLQAQCSREKFGELMPGWLKRNKYLMSNWAGNLMVGIEWISSLTVGVYLQR